MTQVSAWLGAGVFTAGVSAAVLAGAGAANADPAEGADPGGTDTSVSSDADPGAVGSAEHRKRPTLGKRDSVAATQPRRSGIARRVDGSARVRDRSEDADEKTSTAEKTPTAEKTSTAEETSTAEKRTKRELRAERRSPRAVDPGQEAGTEPATTAPATLGTADHTEATSGSAGLRHEITQRTLSLTADRTPTDRDEKPGTDTASPAGLAEDTNPDADTEPADPSRKIPIVGDILGPDQPDYPPLVRAIGSAIFNFLGAVVQTVDGPPQVPQDLKDSVRVSSSTLVVAPGNEIAADWYFPTRVDPAKPPQRLIYLQHGILASGPMYSHTASYLAQRTNSVVVVTTVTSNPFADGGMWLGGDNMHKAVAQLFLDEDREALNASLTTATLKADAPKMTVPKDFVLVGHSLGGGFVPGVAGHYAEGLMTRRGDDPADAEDEANRLAGVVMLDAVPFHPIMPRAMARLKNLESSGDPADFVPMYEIGAPLNLLNAFSSVNDELNDARPGKFNGVVINGGVHMDGMLGGNPLIQAAAYLVAGIPQPQNPPAVQLLMAGWINDMFDGAIDPTTGRCLTDCAGVYGQPGSTIRIPTEVGDASAVVLDSGALPVTDRFVPREASSTAMPHPWQYWIPLPVAA